MPALRLLKLHIATAAPEPRASAGRWWSQWCRWTGFQEGCAEAGAPREAGEAPAERPAAIDNMELLEGPVPAGHEEALRQGLQEGRDYKIVSEPTWRALTAWCARQRSARAPGPAGRAGLAHWRKVVTLSRMFRRAPAVADSAAASHSASCTCVHCPRPSGTRIRARRCHARSSWRVWRGGRSSRCTRCA